MTKLMKLAAILAVVLTSMLASQVSADEFSRALQGTLDITPRIVGQMHRNLYSPYQSYGYGYGVVGHRSRAGRFLHGLLAPEPYYPYGTRPYGYGGYYAYGGHREHETTGKCVERTTKAFRKAKVDFDPELVMAGCTGALRALPQQQGSVEPRPTAAVSAPAPTPATPTPAPTPKVVAKMYSLPTPSSTPSTPKKAKPLVYRQGDKLCNTSELEVTVYVDGRVSAKVPAHGFVTIAKLPFWHQGASLTIPLEK